MAPEMTSDIEPRVSADDLDKIRSSNVFNLAHYNAQLKLSLDYKTALVHYVVEGERQNLTPHALFVPAFVKPQLEALGESVGAGEVLLSYLRHPAAPIDPHPLFNAQYYRDMGVACRGDATYLQEYIGRHTDGAEFVSPCALFDGQYYYERYNDIAAKGLDPLLHYLRHGWLEQRQPHPLFQPLHWRRSLESRGAAIEELCPLLQYFSDPATWSVSPHPLFDPEYYRVRREASDVLGDGKYPPLAEMLAAREPVACHYLFDPAYYMEQAARRGIALGSHPLVHYVRGNGRGELAPHILFDTTRYLEKHPDVERSGRDPLQHYIEVGRLEGSREPNPLFSQRHYASRLSGRVGKDFDLLQHYILSGGRDLIEPHPLFEAELYAAYNPTCLTAGDTPLSHYVRSWAANGVEFPPWGTALTPRRGEPMTGRFDIVVVSHELTHTGAPLILLKIVEQLVARLNLSVLVLSDRGGELLDDFVEWSPVLVLDAARKAGIPARQFLKEILASFATKPRLMLINTVCPELFDYARDDLAAWGVPIMTLAHELASSFDAARFENIYSVSNCIVYPAQFVRDEAHRLYELPIEKTELIPQGLLNPEFGQIDGASARAALLDDLGAPDDAFIVLGCGTIDARKGIDVFVRAAALSLKLERQDDKARPLYFVWVGGGPTDRHSPYWYALQDIRRGGIEDRVHFLGPRTHPEACFVACDAFVMTSRMDPFPCVIHEAMACGKPIIAFEGAGGAAEAIRGGAGITLPYGDVDDMAQAVRRLATEPRLAARYGAKAKKIVRTRYVFKDYVDNLLSAVERHAGVGFEARGATRPRARDGVRTIFTLPSWDASVGQLLLGQIVAGLSCRGIDAEIIFTGDGGTASDAGRLPDLPYRFLLPTFREAVTYRGKWERLERILESAAPAIFVHGRDDVASALAPVVPDRIGVLGILDRDDPACLEQACRLGRYWQRVVGLSERVLDRVAAEMPSLVPISVCIPPGAERRAAPSRRDPQQPLRIICFSPPLASRPTAMLLTALARCVSAAVTVVLERPEDEAALRSAAVAPETLATTEIVAARSAQDIARILGAGDVLVMPYESGHAALGLVEAMSFGVVPIVVDNSGGPCEPIIDGENGFIVTRRERDAVVRRILRLSADAELLGRMRNTAWATIEARSLDLERMYDRYAELVHEMHRALRSGEYVRPKPIYTHPDYGGRSLPPALQLDPDRLHRP
jgi:glycosyltransferase involved in cell wall biosynthesis